jgi:hypothetical protein
MRRRVLILFALSLIGGCAHKNPSPPVLAEPEVIDQRDVFPTWLGSVMTVGGTTLQTITAAEPVAQQVLLAYHDALLRRHMLAEAPLPPQLRMLILIHRFSVIQVVRQQALIDMDLRLNDVVTGLAIYRQRVLVDLTPDKPLAVLPSVADNQAALSLLARQALAQAVHQVVVNPAFRAALRLPPGRTGLGVPKPRNAQP